LFLSKAPNALFAIGRGVLAIVTIEEVGAVVRSACLSSLTSGARAFYLELHLEHFAQFGFFSSLAFNRQPFCVPTPLRPGDQLVGFVVDCADRASPRPRVNIRAALDQDLVLCHLLPSFIVRISRTIVAARTSTASSPRGASTAVPAIFRQTSGPVAAAP
jgi:hypothetical protein